MNYSDATIIDGFKELAMEYEVGFFFSSFTIILLIFIIFILGVTWSSYVLGKTRTNSPKIAATFGFFLSFFLPPFAVVYLVVLFLKTEVDIV